MAACGTLTWDFTMSSRRKGREGAPSSQRENGPAAAPAIEVIDLESITPSQPRKTLSRQVLESIEQWILERKLGPGDILPTEVQIAEELQVSKSSVREAIKMLEVLGVVEIRRGLCTVISANPEQGYMNVLLSHFYLNSGTPQEARAFRNTIEVAYTCLAIEEATDADLEALRSCLEEFRRKVRDGSVTAADDIAFHNQILESTHNSFLIGLGKALNSLFRNSIELSLHQNPQTALADHEAIYQAIIQRNKGAASDAVRRSAEGWANFLSL